MKRVLPLLLVFLVLGALGYWKYSGGNSSSHNETSTPSEAPAHLANRVDTFPAEQAISPESLASATKTVRTDDAQSAILDRIPKKLKPLRVLASDEVTMPTGRSAKRSVVSTDSALGKILVIEYQDSIELPEQEIYSAEHLVVSTGDEQALKSVRASLESAGLTVKEPFPNASFLYLETGTDLPAGIYERLEKASGILGTSGNVGLDGIGSAQAVPTDPYYSWQWHHQKVDSEPAWDITQGSSSIIVAVLDTGLITYPDFQGRTVSGYDYVNSDSDPTDDHGHGTAVAGVIAASANNNSLVAGVDWNCKIMPIKVLDSSNFGYYSWWAAGVDFARTNGARVINLSASGSSSSNTLTKAIDKAIGAGVIFVTSAGNDATGTRPFPANLSQSITVGATDSDDTKSSFSNWGVELDLVAPGRQIQTVGFDGTWWWWSGTSFSAPQVSGTAALLLSLNQDLDQDTVMSLLAAGAEDQVGDSDDTAGFDEYYGWGRLNIYNTLLLAQTSPEVTTAEDQTIHLNWQAPSNADSKQPFKILWSETLSSWTEISSPTITYGDEAEWIDDGSETGVSPGATDRRFYKITVGIE